MRAGPTLGAASGRFSLTRSGYARAVAAAAAAWLGIGVILLGGVLSNGGVEGIGSLLVIAIWLVAVWDAGTPAGQAEARVKLGIREPAETVVFPAVAWLGVGLVPVSFVMLAVFDDGIRTDWINGLSALCIIGLGIYVARPLVTERGRRALLGTGAGEGRVTWLCPLSRLIAQRAAPPSDPVTIEEHRRRRRYAMATECVLVVIACVLFGFTLLFTYLAASRYGVELTGGAATKSEIARASSAFVLWHALDLVPLLDIPHTLNWRLERTFTDHTSGALLLVMKLFIVGPILRMIALLLRGPATRG